MFEECPTVAQGGEQSSCPRQEYPRPDFRREQWLSLNGPWDFCFEGEAPRTIQVPFVYQSALSGIGENRRCDHVTYRRSFRVPAEWRGSQVLLHFGAVDYRAQVYLGESLVCAHEGGQSPFAADITPFLTWGEEELRVEVFDPAGDETIPRGKQFWGEKPEFIWYTPSTGIWQSVWLEPVNQGRWEQLHFTPDIDRGCCQLSWTLAQDTPLPCVCRFSVTLKREVFFEGEVTVPRREGSLTIDLFGNQILRGPFHSMGLCWSPEHPNLFEVTAELWREGALLDRVESYFGMRKFSVENGKLCLNNFPYYQKLVLDQGYWKDGLLTAPDQADYRSDILAAKAMGFNGCRKHEKAEDPVFLAWADRLGYLVWGGMASFISYTPDAAARFSGEWCDIIRRDRNHPSLVVWEMLNESWGVPDIARSATQQAFAQSLYHLAHALDPTRPVVDNDGWEQTCGDICALHSYKHGGRDDPEQQQRFARGLATAQELLTGEIMQHLPYAQGFGYRGQPMVLSEFGGLSVGPQQGSWGYTQAQDEEEFLAEYQRMLEAIRASQALCGFCYTQFTDVQQEKNGLLDENHQPKFSMARIKAIHDRFHD